MNQASKVKGNSGGGRRRLPHQNPGNVFSIIFFPDQVKRYYQRVNYEKNPASSKVTDYLPGID